MRESRSIQEVEFFFKQAKIGGLSISNFPQAFRYDFRDPATVKGSNGFFGNPLKEKQSLMEHSFKDSTGGNNWVSLTLNGENLFLLRQFFNNVEARELTNDIALLSRFKNAFPQMEDQISQLRYFRIFEYTVVNIDAVRVKNGVKFEEEIISSHVQADKILNFREVIYFFNKTATANGMPYAASTIEVHKNQEAVMKTEWMPF